MHHLKGFLIKSILDYAGDDIGSQIIVCGFCSQGKIVPRGRKIPASIQPGVLLRCKRGERGV